MAIANRLRAVDRNGEWLEQGLGRYADADAFAEDWLSDEFRESERVAALERFYDRIVNSTNQIIDTVEAQLWRVGEITDPRAEGGPGRAARLARYGAIDGARVDELRRFLERRNVLQKEYPDLGVEAAKDAYEDAQAFLDLLPALTSGVQAWARASGVDV